MIDFAAIDEMPEEEYIAATAGAMLASLRNHELRVIIIDRQNKLRQAVEHNAQWYRDLCAMHERSRTLKGRPLKRPRTIIRRAHTIKALHRLIDGDTEGEYCQRLLSIIDRYWTDYA